MAQNRYYSSLALPTTITDVDGIDAAVTTINIASVVGLPASYPYTMLIRWGTANVEVVSVTNRSGLALTVTRGQDGTTAKAHPQDAFLVHGVSAQDFTEPQVHMATGGAVHGLSGSIVGTTDTQTLTNKTLTSPAISGPTGIVKADVGLGNVDNTSNATERAATATLTNKTLTAPAITSPTGLVKADVGLSTVDNTSDAVKAAAEATAVRTLTNKTLTAPVINSPTGLVKADVGLGSVDNTSDSSKFTTYDTASRTLTNKTLTLPVIASVSNSGTVTFPTGTRTLVARDTTDTLTNKTLTSPVINTPSGIVKGDVGLGNVDNTSDSSKATTEATAVRTLTNKTLTAPVINSPTGIVKGDVGLGNVDNTSDVTKNAASVTLTNKTLTAPVITTPSMTHPNITDGYFDALFIGSPASPAAGSYRFWASSTGMSLKNSSGTEYQLITDNIAQTMTNKTLTSPAITTPTGIVKGDVGLGNVDNTSDATKNAASVTLTNKTLTSPVVNTPTGIVKGDVGLGNVDNTSDASKATTEATAVRTLTNKTLTTPTIADYTNANHTHTSVATGGMATRPFSPELNGLLAQCVGIEDATTVTAFVVGTIVFSQVRLFAGDSVTGGCWLNGATAGSGLGQSYIGLFSASGSTMTKLALSAAFTTTTASSMNKVAFTSPYSVLTTGYYYVGFQVGTGGTPPSMGRIRTFLYAGDLNGNLAVGSYRGTSAANTGAIGATVTASANAGIDNQIYWLGAY